MKFHPATALTMQVIADRLLDIRFLSAAVLRFRDEFAIKASRAAIVPSEAF